MIDFFTIGNLTIDQVVSADGTKQSNVCGGDCLYSALGIRLWGGRVGIVSVVSEAYSPAWLDDLVVAGLDITGVRKIPGQRHMGGVMLYHPDGSRDFVTQPSEENAGDKQPVDVHLWYEFSPLVSDLPADYLRSKGVHVAPMPISRQEDFLQRIQRNVRTVSIDLPWWAEDQQQGLFPSLNLTHVVLLSEAEVRGFFGEIPVDEGGSALLAAGAHTVVIKMGANGSFVYEKSGKITRVPVFPTKVIDPTGAGDAYCGGFLAGLNETGDPIQAALYGTVSASYAIEAFGATYMLGISRQDAVRRLEKLRSIMQTNRGYR